MSIPPIRQDLAKSVLQWAGQDGSYQSIDGGAAVPIRFREYQDVMVFDGEGGVAHIDRLIGINVEDVAIAKSGDTITDTTTSRVFTIGKIFDRRGDVRRYEVT